MISLYIYIYIYVARGDDIIYICVNALYIYIYIAKGDLQDVVANILGCAK